MYFALVLILVGWGVRVTAASRAVYVRSCMHLRCSVKNQGLGEGKKHKYSVQYYPALRKNVEKPQRASKII